MDHGTTRVQEHIGDPVVGEAPVDREQLEEIFQDIQSDMRFDHELNGCLNCGICTATARRRTTTISAPARSCSCCGPRTWWASTTPCRKRSGPAPSCYTCAARCPFGNSPGGSGHADAGDRDQAWHGKREECAAPFSRVMLKLISTGNSWRPT